MHKFTLTLETICTGSIMGKCMTRFFDGERHDTIFFGRRRPQNRFPAGQNVGSRTSSSYSIGMRLWNET